MSPNIAIVGAGPVGCMLARMLHLGGIDAVVYEGEPAPNYRSQGGTLDLHTGTGLAAMQDAGLLEAFKKRARYDGEYMTIRDWRLRELFTRGDHQGDHTGTPRDVKSLGEQRPEIDRSELRQILTESLPEGMIRWGHRVREVVLDEADGSATLVFSDDSAAEAAAAAATSGFDLVVGADGAWSKVRNALSKQKPEFAGVVLHELRVADAAKRAPALAALVHGGTVFAHADGRKLGVQQMGDGSLSVGTFMRADEDWTRGGAAAASERCGYDVSSLAAVKAALLNDPRRFGEFSPRIQAAIRLAGGGPDGDDDNSDEVRPPRPLYRLPIGFHWPHRRGATLIGDAAHVMTPFAGEGVNCGLDDARRLAESILGGAAAQTGDAAAATDAVAERLDDAVRLSEMEMVARCARFTKLADDLTKLWFYTPGAPYSVIAPAISMHACTHLPALLHPLVRAGVHGYFLVQKWRLGKKGEDEEEEGQAAAVAKKVAKQ